MKHFAVAMAVAILVSCSPQRETPPLRREIAPPPLHPNVLLIVIDTLRYDDSGVASPSATSTSFLQRLASRSIVFDRSYSTFDETVNTHFSLLTGFVYGSGTALDDPANSIAAQLKRAGYRTIGVAANGNLAAKVFPLVRAFDRYSCLYDDWFPITKSRIRKDSLSDLDAFLDKWHGRHDEFNRFMVYSDARRAVDRLTSELDRASQPFFAFINVTDPHDPYFPDPSVLSPEADERAGVPAGFDPDMRYRELKRYRDQRLETPAMRRAIAGQLKAVHGRKWSLAYDLTPGQIAVYRRRYRAEVRAVERELDRLMSWLQNRRLLESTIVIITSDHGESFGERGFMSHALDRKGDREATQRVPLFFLFPPSYRYSPMRISVPTTSADLAPTIYDYAAVDWSPLASVADVGNFGKSLRDFVDGGGRVRYNVSAEPSRGSGAEEREKIDRERTERLRALGYIH